MQVIALKHIVFLFVGLLCLTPLISSPLALVLGITAALLGWVPSHVNVGAIVKKLLAISIVGLGFGVNLEVAARTSGENLILIIFYVVVTLGLALGFAKLLRLDNRSATLIGSGTAICGGSAIAAMAPTIQARAEQIAVALGCVFILNALALLVFPPLGQWLGLSQYDFGVWAAIAIHDTSSVVGAAEVYGDEALIVATTVKLTRALAIVPMVLITALVYQHMQRRRNVDVQSKLPTVPLFIVFYVLAILIAEFLPQGAPVYEVAFDSAKRVLVVCLYLIGASMSLNTIRKAGFKPMLLAILLWLFVSISSLWWIML
ncbi:YeiH family protein [Aliidiomarina haloalkalitolerans]|uniref:Putative sulfate exporter family transporter n=1 Tax=Aliidiomarina haloalkalitolerans TaxID=859059 RepID=A0A432VVS2_9GAMM|nr:putative sulfate exporter family transporter [Aliidiomarina haloalkalitolerans]RUO20700.1 putative sulfate exporter family transporter [Aliidiomarina haloalkalitolerans]